MESIWNNLKYTQQPVQEKKNKRADWLSRQSLIYNLQNEDCLA